MCLRFVAKFARQDNCCRCWFHYFQSACTSRRLQTYQIAYWHQTMMNHRMILPWMKFIFYCSIKHVWFGWFFGVYDAFFMFLWYFICHSINKNNFDGDTKWFLLLELNCSYRVGYLCSSNYWNMFLHIKKSYYFRYFFITFHRKIIENNIMICLFSVNFDESRATVVRYKTDPNEPNIV